MAPPRYLHIALAAAVFLAGILLAGPSTCWAVGIEGTVQSIDVAARKLSLTRKTANGEKTVSLDVSAEAGDLSSLKKGDGVMIEYDPEQEVAKSITVGGLAADNEPLSRDMKAFQGEWEAVGAEFGGEPLDRIAVRRLNRLIRIKGNSFHEERLHDGKTVGVDGKFEINPKTKAFDFVGKVTGTNNAFEYVGMYEFDGDTLKLCCRANEDGNASRPKQFKSDTQKPNWSHYYVYKRLKE